MSNKVLIVADDAHSARIWVPKGIVASELPSVPSSQASVQDVPDLPDLPVEVASAEPLMEEASAKIEDQEEVLDQAREQAYALGLAEGRREAEHAATVEHNALLELMKNVEALRTDLQANLAAEVLSLSLDLAKQLVRQTLALRPEVVLPLLREALLALPGLGQQVVLHLHPLDATLVTPLLAQDPAMGQIAWSIAEDARIERGGCRLETAQSEVDATLATRWSRMVAALGSEDAWQSSAHKE